jgi:hypothetical protein
MQAMEKGHVSISSGMKSASRPALLHADLVMRRLAFTTRDLARASLHLPRGLFPALKGLL